MNIDTIKEIMKTFSQSSIAKMELDTKDLKIRLEKEVQGEIVHVAPTPVVSSVVEQQPKEQEAGTWVKAPLVGTYYSARSAGATPFVQIGQRVKKGDILCIIEAMKVMNEIASPVDGVVSEIVVTNEAMVEFDQELIRIGEVA